MPSSPGYVRDYKAEKKTADARGEKADNAKRKRARRAMLKLGMVKKGQDVDHKTPISKGGGNSTSNLRAVAPSTNRSFPRKSSGAMK